MFKLLLFVAMLCLAQCRPQASLRLHNRPHHPSIPQLGKIHQNQPIDEDDFEDYTEKPIVLPGRSTIVVPASAPSLSPSVIVPKTFMGKIEPSEYEKFQNENARYQFTSDIDDHISDLTHQRMETRDGLNVKGSYSYSDGYYKRTVHYEADDKGYRVTGMEAIPLDGPHVDLSGMAEVSNAAHGTQLHYRVVSVPVDGPVAKVVDPILQQ